MRNLFFILVFVIYGSTHQAKSVIGEWTSLSHSKFRIHTSWQNDAEPKIGLEFQFNSGWYSYFDNPGDSGSNLKLQLSSNPKGVSIRNVDYPIPESYALGPVINYIYKDDLFLPVNLKVSDQSIYDLSLSLEYLVCENSCIPQFAKTQIKLTPGLKSRRWDSISSKYDYASTVIAGVYEKFNKNLILKIPSVKAISAIYPEYNIFTPGTNLLTAQKEDWTYIKFAIGNLKVRSFYALLKHENQIIRANFVKGNVGSPPGDFTPITNQDKSLDSLNYDYWLVLLMAFLGGLLLNIMPCIFPVIALKLIQLVKMGENSEDSPSFSSLNAWMYLSGILFSFGILGIMLEILRQAGLQIGWGFQLQNPAFVASMVLLFFIISLNLAGVFEVNISVTRKSTPEQGPMHSFATGVLACVVATPCTAPFMATALGYALFLDSQAQRMLLFIFMGFGMAFPIWFIEIFPSIRSKCINLLPKPGPWMVTFKQILAYPMLLASVWLLWVFGKQTGTAEVYMILLTLILMTATLQVYQASFYWKSIWRNTILVGIVVQFIAVALYFNPSSTNYNDDSFSYHKFDMHDLQNNLRNGQSVFVIATADWCVSCKFNERLVLQTKTMEDFYREQKIKVMIADWTKYDSEITGYLNSFNRAGVPLYVIYQNGKPKILPQILTQNIVENAILNSKEFQ